MERTDLAGLIRERKLRRPGKLRKGWGSRRAEHGKPEKDAAQFPGHLPQFQDVLARAVPRPKSLARYPKFQRRLHPPRNPTTTNAIAVSIHVPGSGTAVFVRIGAAATWALYAVIMGVAA